MGAPGCAEVKELVGTARGMPSAQPVDILSDTPDLPQQATLTGIRYKFKRNGKGPLMAAQRRPPFGAILTLTCNFLFPIEVIADK